MLGLNESARRAQLDSDEKVQALSKSIEKLRERFSEFIDIYENPNKLFTSELSEITTETTLESYTNLLENLYGENVYKTKDGDGTDFGRETVMLPLKENESISTCEYTTLPTLEAKRYNLRQLLENSAMEYRMQMSNNPYNLNSLTPFEAFMPFVLVKTFVAPCAQEITNFTSPTKPIFRTKEHIKYIVTKKKDDDIVRKYRRPDIYADIDKSNEILSTAKGAPITSEWFPKGIEEESTGEGDKDHYVDNEGISRKTPDKVNFSNLDLLAESGGIRSIGDALDINVAIDAVKLVYEIDGEKREVVISGLDVVPDVTSTSPQRSFSYPIKFIDTNSAGESVEISDTFYGEYNYERSTVQITSQFDIIKQVRFKGNLSNKNNTNYLSFADESTFNDYRIPEGYKGNVPITIEDMQLFNACGDINIVSYAINEFSEMFLNLEDSQHLSFIRSELLKNEGVTNHPYSRFEGKKLVFSKSISLKIDAANHLKIYEQQQDKMNYAIDRLIASMRNTFMTDPFKITAIAHPNVTSLFVGDNVNWNVTKGSGQSEPILNSYNMGIRTSAGTAFKIVSTMKMSENDGIMFKIDAVNPENFLGWAHYTYSMIISREYRTSENPNVPNVMSYARFSDKCFTPVGGFLRIEDYEDIV